MKNTLFLILLLLFIAPKVSADHYDFGVPVENGAATLYFSITSFEDRTVKVVYPGDMVTNWVYMLDIPSTVSYEGVSYSVTAIGDWAFYHNYSVLWQVTIPSTVTHIGKKAFFGCYSLQQIAIPNSVTVIDREAFLQCTGLEEVIIGSSVTAIGNGAFRQCTGLRK